MLRRPDGARRRGSHSISFVETDHNFFAGDIVHVGDN